MNMTCPQLYTRRVHPREVMFASLVVPGVSNVGRAVMLLGRRGRWEVSWEGLEVPSLWRVPPWGKPLGHGWEVVSRRRGDGGQGLWRFSPRLGQFAESELPPPTTGSTTIFLFFEKYFVVEAVGVVERSRSELSKAGGETLAMTSLS